MKRPFKATALAPRRAMVGTVMAPEAVFSTSPPAAVKSTEVTGSKVGVGAAREGGSRTATTTNTIKPMNFMAGS